MRDEDVVELRLRERVRDTAIERIGQFVLDEALFNVRSFAIIEQGIAQAAAEEPVERSDVRFLERIEVAADDRGPRRVALRHRELEFLQAPRGLCEH